MKRAPKEVLCVLVEGSVVLVPETRLLERFCIIPRILGSHFARTRVHELAGVARWRAEARMPQAHGQIPLLCQADKLHLTEDVLGARRLLHARWRRVTASG